MLIIVMYINSSIKSLTTKILRLVHTHTHTHTQSYSL